MKAVSPWFSTVRLFEDIRKVLVKRGARKTKGSQSTVSGGRDAAR